MTRKTKGIIIKRMDFHEADRILTILTQDHGKIKAIAKGSRKILSKLGGSLEPFCLVDFIFYEGKSFYIVTSAVVQNHFKNIHTDIEKTAKAFYIGELLDKFLEEKQNHPEVFELFAKYLTELECHLRPDRGSTLVDARLRGKDFLIPVFSAKILENLGFKPEVSECLHCRQKLQPAQNYWDDVEGGVICQSCHDKFGHGGKISNDIVKILRLIFAHDFNVGTKLKIDDEYKKDVGRVLESYIEGVIEKELKSKKFLKEMSD